MLELLTLTTEEVSHYDSIPTGRIAITAPHGFDAPLVAPIIAQLCAEYPKLLPELHFSDVRLDLLKHKLDMSIAVGELKDSAYHAIPIGYLDSILVASPAYLAREKFVSADSLSEHTLIQLPWQNKSTLTSANAKQAHFKSHKLLKVNTTISAINSAKCGIGIALVPSIFVRQAIESGGLQQVIPAHEGAKRAVYTLHTYQHQLPLVLRLFVNQLIS